MEIECFCVDEAGVRISGDVFMAWEVVDCNDQEMNFGSSKPALTTGQQMTAALNRGTYFVTVEDGHILRVNIDNPRDISRVKRPQVGVMHVDTVNFMLYYSSFGGSEIFKEPVNFAGQGKVVSVINELDGVSGIAYNPRYKSVYWITHGDGKLTGLGFYTGKIETLYTGLKQPRMMKIDM